MEPQKHNQLMQTLEEIQVLLAEMNKYRFAEHFIDTAELTQLLKVSQKTARLWRESGLIPFAQLGKKIYYRLSDIEALFDKEFARPKHLKKKSALQRTRIRQNSKSKGWEIRI